jgi:hypothetical protein
LETCRRLKIGVSRILTVTSYNEVDNEVTVTSFTISVEQLIALL